MKALYSRKKDKRWVVRCRDGGRMLWTRIAYQNYALNGEEVPFGHVIHHINENKEDDRIDNLIMLPDPDHRNLHGTGRYHSDESKSKMSNAKKGIPLSTENRRKVTEKNKSRTGIPLPLETRHKIGLANKGRKLSEETKSKISMANKGRINGPLTVETKEKLSLALKGKTLTEEAKAKISNAAKTRIRGSLPEKTKEKLSIALKAISMTEEQREKRRLAANTRWAKQKSAL